MASAGERVQGDVRDAQTPAPAEPAPTQRPTTQDIFQVLGNARRRFVLHHLRQGGGVSTKYELSRAIAAWEHDVPAGEVTAEQRKPVYIALHQTHLPQMADRGVVTYDDDGTVALTESVEDLEVYFDVVAGGDVPWSVFYLGLGLLASAAIAASVAGLPPFGLVPPIAWAAGVAGAFTAAAAVHHSRDRRYNLGGDGAPPLLAEE